ncbi:MAG: hypothetical protein FJY17_04865 [Bacteroidetes bacterium]|nr:hypothetical protein [Bacteroidota bacterium]
MIDYDPIDIGNSVDLTLFDPSVKWIYTKENNFSRHPYSPHLNKEFTGKVLGIIRNSDFIFIE